MGIDVAIPSDMIVNYHLSGMALYPQENFDGLNFFPEPTSTEPNKYVLPTNHLKRTLTDSILLIYCKEIEILQHRLSRAAGRKISTRMITFLVADRMTITQLHDKDKDGKPNISK